MKQKHNVATWWRYISGRKMAENAIDHYALTAKMAPPGGEIYFLCHTSSAKFPSLSHAKNILWISSIS